MLLQLLLCLGEEVLAAWFAGKHEKSSDVAIWLSRRNGDGWSAPVKIADEDGIAHWNPVLYADGDSLLLSTRSVMK